MRNRTLTGQRAVFSFQNGYLVTSEGRGMEPGQLSYLALTCTIAREWSTMMREERECRREKPGKACSAKVSEQGVSAGTNVIYLRDVLRQRREQRSSMGGLMRGSPWVQVWAGSDQAGMSTARVRRYP
ncbi:hypothetical protein QY702_05970 [Xanthomonas campestris pv. plantaginis]|uniref:hypothetical protein n=1 Tax=Xanthomonas campestris TaxID=339 RepID=UPI002B228DA9|nr:hypothetical protein [Xanthomonas campestris]MEA9606007.1 hypothetical protein [Xanthomonas campestris pv. plantaginis]